MLLVRAVCKYRLNMIYDLFNLDRGCSFVEKNLLLEFCTKAKEVGVLRVNVSVLHIVNLSIK